jgi:hypothetical protein
MQTALMALIKCLEQRPNSALDTDAAFHRHLAEVLRHLGEVWIEAGLQNCHLWYTRRSDGITLLQSACALYSVGNNEDEWRADASPESVAAFLKSNPNHLTPQGIDAARESIERFAETLLTSTKPPENSPLDRETPTPVPDRKVFSVEQMEAIKADNERRKDAAELAAKLRRRRWEEAFVGIPLPATPAELLAECQRLRRDLDGPTEKAGLMVACAPEVEKRLKQAIRGMGGAVPKWRPLSACTASEALADRLLDGERMEALHQVIDAVVAWCAARGAVVRADADDPTALVVEPQLDGGGARSATPDGSQPLSRLLSASDLQRALSERLGRPCRGVASFLARHRKVAVDCFEMVEGRRRTEPKIIYRTADVWPVLWEKYTRQK